MADIVKEDKKEGSDLSVGNIFEIIGDFLLLALLSVLIGVGMGMLSAFLSKHFRVISHSAVSESAYLILLAMMSYFVSEVTHNSGIVTLLTCSVVMTHYTWFNLSP